MTVGPGRVTWPLDIFVIVVMTLATVVVTLVPSIGLRGTPINVVLGFAFVFYVPGAALASALFPGKASRESSWRDRDWTVALDDGGRVSTVERLVLSLGLSIAVVPLVGLFMMFLSVDVTLGTSVLAIAFVSLSLAAIGTVRRVRLPPEERFGVPLTGYLATGARPVGTDGRTGNRLFSVVLVAGLVLAATGIGFAVLSPQPGERFTEFSLQTRDPETGELVADGYPSELGVDDSATLYVGLTNQEHRTLSYSIVVQLQRLDSQGESASVLERRELDRFDATVAHNESWSREVSVEPAMQGENLRLKFLLYRGTPPSDPTADNAYRDAHIWIDVA